MLHQRTCIMILGPLPCPCVTGMIRFLVMPSLPCRATSLKDIYNRWHQFNHLSPICWKICWYKLWVNQCVVSRGLGRWRRTQKRKLHTISFLNDIISRWHQFNHLSPICSKICWYKLWVNQCMVSRGLESVKAHSEQEIAHVSAARCANITRIQAVNWVCRQQSNVSKSLFK